jgi:hypothetical protein
VSKVKLFEFTALVSHSVVVAAVNEEDARGQISDWEETWKHQEFLEVSDVDLVHVSDFDHPPECISDLASEVTQLAADTLSEPTVEHDRT